VKSVSIRKKEVSRLLLALLVFLLDSMAFIFIGLEIYEEKGVRGLVIIGTKANIHNMEDLPPIEVLVIRVI
jgi:hypothetical protein